MNPYSPRTRLLGTLLMLLTPRRVSLTIIHVAVAWFWRRHRTALADRRLRADPFDVYS